MISRMGFGHFVILFTRVVITEIKGLGEIKIFLKNMDRMYTHGEFMSMYCKTNTVL